MSGKEGEIKNWYILIKELNVICQPDRKKQIVWSLLDKNQNKKANEIWVRETEWREFCGFSKSSLEISHYFFVSICKFNIFKMEVYWNIIKQNE